MLSRQYTLEKYAELLSLPKEDTICINLEKSTYNTTIRRTNELGDVPAAENRFFVNRYKHTFLKIKHNLIHSPTLKARILSGELKPKSVLELSHQGLWPTPNIRVCLGVIGVNHIRRPFIKCKHAVLMNQ
jgi:hypothetical protein